MRGWLTRWLLAALVAGAVTQGGSPALGEPGDDLTISVLTFGPGDHPFFKFGHNAILVQAPNQPGWVFNFGTFAFDTAALIPKFLRGRFKYWLSVSTLDDTIESYAAANRSILAQELDLTPAQKRALAEALRINARPENREYLYDYFRDNCSTRVRDAVDRVVGGQVHQAGLAPASGTFRSHALRMVADLWPEYVGIDLALGPAADAPITWWDEAFLPERLADLLRKVQLADGGATRPLVKAEATLHKARRPPKPAQAPSWNVAFLLVGLAVGAAVMGVGRLGRRRPAARAGFGVLLCVIGGGFGLLGLVLLSLWCFTDHRIAYANANILQLAPWAVVLFVYGIGVGLGRRGAASRANMVLMAAGAFAVVGLVAKALPGVRQDNWPFILLVLPIWLGFWAGLRQMMPAARK